MGGMTRRRWLGLLVLAAALVAAGCTSAAGDKAGGGNEPVVLKMAEQGDLSTDLATADFVRRVGALSHGQLRIDVVANWGNGQPGAEQQIVRDVGAGKADLSAVGTRVFDTLGVTSLQALTAPMLIDSYPLERAAIASNIPTQMLKSLGKLGITGLAVFGQGLRKPAAAERPLMRPADWRGITFVTPRSRGQDEAIRALGARTADVGGIDIPAAIAQGEALGMESSLLNYQRNSTEVTAPYVTLNVTLWPRTTALLANTARFSKLTAEQQGWLRQAARATTAVSVALFDKDQQLVEQICGTGAHLANASPADLAAMKQAFAPVYASLEQDPQTKAFIGQIEALKRSTPPGPPLAIPAGCHASAGQPPTADPLAGTWRTGHITESQIVRAFVAGGGSEKEGHAFFSQLGGGATRYAVITVSFRDGKYQEYESGDGGPSVLGDQATYMLADDTSHTLRFGDNDCTSGVRYEVSDNTLRLSVVKPCALNQWDNALFDTFPFSRMANAP